MGKIVRGGCVQLQQHEHGQQQLLQQHGHGEHVQRDGAHGHDGLGEDECIQGEVDGVANEEGVQLGWLLLVVVAVVAVQLEGEMVQEHDVQVLEYGDS